MSPRGMVRREPSRAMGSALVLLVLGLSGCGATESSAVAPPMGTVRSVETQAGEPVEFRLRTTTGELVHSRQWRGRRVLLFFFATFDVLSQAALEVLASFVAAQNGTLVIGVAVEPDARELVGPWTAAADPPFVTGWTPEEAPTEGLRGLEPVDAVPTFVALESDGRAVGRVEGFVNRRQLEGLWR